MKKSKLMGLVASMESLDEAALAELEAVPLNSTEETVDPEVGEPQPEQPETVDIDFGAASESPEALEVEVVQAENEAVSVEQHIDEGMAVLEQVEQVSDIVERANENGGLTPSGAELLAVTLEGLYDRVGLEVAERQVPSFENFGGVSSRLHCGTVSVENMAERAKEIWDNILKAIQVGIQKGMEFVKQMMDQTARYKTKLLKLKEALNNSKWDKDVTFPSERTAYNLSINGKFVGRDNIAPAAKKVVEIGKVANEATDYYLNGTGKGFLDVLKLAESATSEIITKKLEELLKGTNEYIKRSNFIKNVQDDSVVSEEFLGGFQYKIQLPKNLENFGKVRVELIRKEEMPGEGVSPANKQSALQSIEVALELINEIEIHRKNVDNAAAVKKQIVAASNSLKAAEARANNDEAKGRFTMLRQAVPAMAVSVDSLPKAFIRHALTVVQGISGYAEEVVRGLNEKPAGGAESTAAAA